MPTACHLCLRSQCQRRLDAQYSFYKLSPSAIVISAAPVPQLLFFCQPPGARYSKKLCLIWRLPLLHMMQWALPFKWVRLFYCYIKIFSAGHIWSSLQWLNRPGDLEQKRQFSKTFVTTVKGTHIAKVCIPFLWHRWHKWWVKLSSNGAAHGKRYTTSKFSIFVFSRILMEDSTKKTA